MDIELDADIESLESLINDEINNSNQDDCSENSFDAELNLLASTLKENDMHKELNNENEEKCDAQSNLKSVIEPNNHIIDKSSKKSVKLSHLKGSRENNVKSISEVEIVDGRECHKEYHETDNFCNFSKPSSELGASLINEQSSDLKCRSDLEEHGTCGAADISQCGEPRKIEFEKYDETGNSIENSENLKEHILKKKCIERMEEEMKENDFETSAIDKYIISSGDEKEARCEIHCSTPIVREVAVKKVTADCDKISSFGLLSPLTTYSSAAGGSCHLKRKLCTEALQSIKEEEEEPDVPSKKTKCDTEDSCVARNLKSPMKTIEPPAMTILKKWRPKCLSSSSSFYLLDECGVSDAQANQSGKEDDDFEVAMKSLSEELIRQSNSDDLKTLDLYHNHVLAENEEDGLKFEEILQQMTNELEGMSEFIGLDERDESARSDDDVEKNETTVIEIDCQKGVSSALAENSQKSNDSTFVNELTADNSSGTCEDKITTANEAVKEDNTVTKESGKPVQNHSEELSPNNTEYITLTADEEDVLLEDEPEIIVETDTNQNKKPREMVEFISKDPKENEDNFNPEWELLRKLNTDEERYKAVRQRWRSLVIPDPKRDLTFRQWRRRNNLPPSKHLKGNPKASKQQIRKYVGNQLCTALFDQNIEGVLRQKEEKRLALHKELQVKIMRLGHIQNQEQQQLYELGGSYQQFSHLYLRHMEELRRLQGEHQKRLENEELASFEKIEALKKASAEVLAFEKFYQGLDNDKNDNAVFLSDIEIQELMETEIMLEQYDKYYV